jgi:hypothetical protein
MNRRDAFYEQLVSSGNVNEWLNDPEVAERAIMSDLGFSGIMSGLVASQNSSPPNLTVDVTGGLAYDQLGERCFVPSTQTVDLSVDYLSVSTAVVGAGNSKVISLFIQFDRLLQTPVTDGNGNTVYYDELEYYSWFVVQGSEAPTGTQVPPAKVNPGLLVCNVTIAYGATAIVNGDITATTRDSLVVIQPGGTPLLSIREGSYLAALVDIVTAVNSIAAGSAGLTATGIAYAGSGDWVNSITGIPAGSVASALSAIVADLASEAGDGASKIGVGNIVGATSVIPEGSVKAALVALQGGAVIEMVASGAFADASTLGATNIQAWLGNLVSKLAAISTNDGAGTIGAKTSGSLVAGSVRSQLDALNAGKVSVVTSGNHYPLPSGDVVTRVQETPFVNLVSTPSVSVAGMSANPGDVIQVAVNAPHGATINSIALREGAGGGVVPGTKASFVFYEVDVTTGSIAALGTASDATVNTGSHDLSLAGLTVVVDRSTKHYYLIYTAESGGTSAARTIYSPRVTSTVPNIDDACV